MQNAQPNQAPTQSTQGGRWTKAAIADRRSKVFDFVMLRGMSETACAEVLAVSRNTIVGDVKALKDDMKGRVKSLDVLREIGEQVKTYEALAQSATFEADSCKQPGAKAMLISQALRAYELKQRLLIETGYYPQATQKHSHSVNGQLNVSGTIDFSQLTKSELHAHRGRLIEQLRGHTVESLS